MSDSPREAASLPLVAILGRPNVGKSTLFNRLLGENRAIVEDQPGVTRDRHYATVTRGPWTYRLVDTGGSSSVTIILWERRSASRPSSPSRRRMP